MRNPVPWHDDGPGFEPAPLTALADKIDARAASGLTTHLKPDTARVCSGALRMVANGPLTNWDIQKKYAHTVRDFGRTDGEIPRVLAYTASVHLAIGAWEKAVVHYPGRRLAVRWGVFTPKKNF